MPHFDDYDLFTSLLDDADEMVFKDTTDTSDTGTGAGTTGKTKRAKVANLSRAFYKGAYLVLPDGSNTASTNATLINDAISAAVTAGIGVVKCAPVAWNVAAGTISHDGSGLYLDLRGVAITGSGSGDLIRMFDSSDFDTRTVHGGGVIGMPRFYGTSMTSDSCAVHIGDIPEADVEIMTYDFNTGTDSMGLHWDNCYGHSEGSHARVFTQNCMTGIVHDVNGGATATGAHTSAKGSYERCVLDYQCVQGDDPTYKLVEWRNGAFQVGGRNGVHGNVGGSASTLTQGAVSITGSTPSGITEPSDSILLNVELNWDVERDGADANSPLTVSFGGDVNAVVNCTGMVNFGGGAPMQSSNSAGQWVGFVGVINGDANLPSSLPAATTNIASGAQTISSTTAADVAGLSLPVAAFTAYEVELYVPYSSTKTAGTPVFIFSGPSWDTAEFTWWYQTNVTPWTTVKTVATSAPTMTGPTLSTAANLALMAKGTVVLTAAGTLGLQAKEGTSTDTFVVGGGAYLKLTPMAAPS